MFFEPYANTRPPARSTLNRRAAATIRARTREKVSPPSVERSTPRPPISSTVRGSSASTACGVAE